MSKVLVTGCAGAIGSLLCDKLIELGHGVVGIDNFFSGKPKNINDKVEFHQADIRSMPQGLMDGVEVVFHLAALTKLVPSLQNPLEYHDVNVNGTVNILNAAKKAGVKRVVFASSSAIYGPRDTMLEDETMFPLPQNPYGTTKIVGEYYMRCWSTAFELDTVSLRYFNVFGARENENSEHSCLITKFIKQKRNNEPLTICGDGEQRFDFVHVDDVVDATIKAGFEIRRMNGESINIGTGKNYSINRVATMIDAPTVSISGRPGDVKWTLADNSKAFAYLGWTPAVGLADGIERLKND